MDVARLREQIPVCQRMVYVNSGWSGPSPVSVVEAIKQRLDYEMEQGPTTPEVSESGREIQEAARESVAKLINASTEEIVLTQNTTDGLNIAINGISWREGDEIITFSLEHSSVLIPGYYKQRRHGAVVKVLDIAPDEAAGSLMGKLEEAVTDRTRLVFMSHIQYACGLRMPVDEIRRLTADRGILLLLDGAQTAGHIALDMQSMQPDFYSIPGQKWLLGAEGTGALYIRKELIPELEPTSVAGRSVVSMNDPYVFDPNISSIDKFRPSSTSAALRAGMVESIRFIQEAGVGEIEERNLDLATYMKQALQETPGVRVRSPMDRGSSSGLVSFEVEGVEPAGAVSHMWEQHRIVCRQVGSLSCIRVSLHFFNTEEEIDRIVGAVRDLVGK